MMLAFDTPIPFNSIGRRNVSNVPAQALILMNDPFVVEQAKKWATRIVEIDEPITARINRLYKEAFGRPVNQTEIEAAQDFLSLQAKELEIKKSEIASDIGLWADYCHTLLNVKEFIYIK